MPRETTDRRTDESVARGLLIAKERNRQQLTQSELADLVTAKLRQTDAKAALTRSHLGQIELGLRGLSEQKLRALAAVLGLKETKLRLPFLQMADAA